jgi:electron transfer flavoprotein alpha subunit
MSILVVAETRNGELKKASLSAVTCARILAEKTGLNYNILTFEPSEKTKEELSQLGAEKLFVAKGEHLKNYTAENYAIAVSEVAKKIDAKYILATATTFGKDLLPRLVVKIPNSAMVSEVIEVIDGETFKRLMYAGDIIATLKIKSEKKVLSVRGTAFDKAGKVDKKSEIVEEEIKESYPRKRFIELQKLQ